MKKTMKKIDVAALAKVVGGGRSPTKRARSGARSDARKIMGWTIFDGVVSTVGAAIGAMALWDSYKD